MVNSNIDVPSTLRDHIMTGTCLMYSYCDSCVQFESKIRSEAPDGYSIFVCAPHGIWCDRYIHNGRPEEMIRSRFNDANKGRADLMDVVMACMGAVASKGKTGRDATARPVEKTIPQKSIILCEHYVDAINAADVRSKLHRISKSASYANYGIHLIFYSDNPITNSFLKQHGTEIKIPPMTDEEIRTHFKRRSEAEKRSGKKSFLGNPQMVEAMIPSVKGLPIDVIDGIIDWGLLKHPNAKDVHEITAYADEVQAKSIRQSDILSFLPYSRQSDPKYIGGYETLMKDMEEAAVGFSPEAARMGIEPPRGIVLVGIPGTGKTMAAQALGRILDLRVIVFHMSRVFGKYLGDSESRVLKALDQIDNFGRCVLFIDEADKSMSGGGNSDSGDNHTTQRVLGEMLQWLQNHKGGVYTVMTMNNFQNVQLEFMRAGRIDNIYFSGFPVPSVRKDIFVSHFNRHNIANTGFSDSQWHSIVMATKMFVGSEIESIVNESMRLAFLRRKSSIPTFDEVMEKIHHRTPMAYSDPYRIISILSTCYRKFRPVGSSSNPEVDEFINIFKKGAKDESSDQGKNPFQRS